MPEPPKSVRPKSIASPPSTGGEIVVRGDDGRNYRVVEKLGQGGFGTVYRVWVEDLAGLSRQVALKVLKDDVPDEVAVRFRDEARMLGLVQHRAIVGIEGLVTLDGQLAAILEYVPGVDLKAIIEHQPPPAAVVVRIVEEVASALHAAYAQVNDLTGRPLHLIHRDIKPANVRLTAGGEVRVVDFGGARADFGAREAQTRSFVVGSYRYMAPERLDLVDTPASDVYSLGLVMSELLLGDDTPAPSKHGGQHEAWLGGLLDGVRERLEGELHPQPVVDRALILLRSMLDYHPDRRPSARKVELAARHLQSALAGPFLREWAEQAVSGLEREERSGATPVVSRRAVFPSSADRQAPILGIVPNLPDLDDLRAGGDHAVEPRVDDRPARPAPRPPPPDLTGMRAADTAPVPMRELRPGGVPPVADPLDAPPPPIFTDVKEAVAVASTPRPAARRAHTTPILEPRRVSSPSLPPWKLPPIHHDAEGADWNLLGAAILLGGLTLVVSALLVGQLRHLERPPAPAASAAYPSALLPVREWGPVAQPPLSAPPEATAPAAPASVPPAPASVEAPTDAPDAPIEALPSDAERRPLFRFGKKKKK